MKFGLYSSIANPPRGEHLDRCIDEVIAEAQLAEASGFDSCFFGEHHQDHDGFLPSPLIVATAVAARTRDLRVGTSVILLPLHHPVHVAEDLLTLDLVPTYIRARADRPGGSPRSFRCAMRGSQQRGPRPTRCTARTSWRRIDTTGSTDWPSSAPCRPTPSSRWRISRPIV